RIEIAGGESRVEAGPPGGRRIRPHAAAADESRPFRHFCDLRAGVRSPLLDPGCKSAGITGVCRQRVEARQRLVVVVGFPKLASRDETVGSESEQLEEHILERPAAVASDAEIGAANQEGIRREGEYPVGAPRESYGDLGLQAGVVEELRGPSCAPGAEVPMVYQLHGWRHRGRQAIGTNRS